MRLHKIEFTDDLRTGIDTLDRQHRKIFDIYNKMVYMLIDTNDIREIANNFHIVVNDLAKYVMCHFTEEERFMKQMNYSHFEEHKKSHIEIHEKLMDYCLEISKNTVLIDEFLEFFIDWLLNHIKKRDLDFIREYRQKKTSENKEK